MAKLSDYDLVSPLLGAATVPVVQDGLQKKTTASDIAGLTTIPDIENLKDFPNLIVVSPDANYGQFTSVKTALEYATANPGLADPKITGATMPNIVMVMPGVYYEQAFTITNGVILTSMYQDSPNSVINNMPTIYFVDNSTGDMITLNGSCGISNLKFYFLGLSIPFFGIDNVMTGPVSLIKIVDPASMNYYQNIKCCHLQMQTTVGNDATKKIKFIEMESVGGSRNYLTIEGSFLTYSGPSASSEVTYLYNNSSVAYILNTILNSGSGTASIACDALNISMTAFFNSRIGGLDNVTSFGTDLRGATASDAFILSETEYKTAAAGTNVTIDDDKLRVLSAEPADSELSLGELVSWFDSTNTELKFKHKDATTAVIRTAAVNLT